MRADVSQAEDRVFLPQWIDSNVEVSAVDLERAVAHFGSTNGGASELPVSGRLGLRLALRMPLGADEGGGESLANPHAWSGSGRVEGPEVDIRSARFRRVSATLALKAGRLTVSDLAARLDGHPLKGEGAVDLTAPYAFVSRLEASSLPLAQLLALTTLRTGGGKVSGTVGRTPRRVGH